MSKHYDGTTGESEVGPDSFPGTDEGSHYMSQTKAEDLIVRPDGFQVRERTTAVQPISYRNTAVDRDKMYQLVEIYQSVKGEGTQAGMPMVFVRFSKCNLACEWCDTPYNRVAIRLTGEQLIQAILNYLPAWVVFTGGEPMMQLDDYIVESLKEAGIKLAIETNGLIYKSFLPRIDYINVSPKIGQFLARQIHESLVIDECRFTLADNQRDIWNVMTGEPVGPVFDELKGSLDPKALGTMRKLIGVETKQITISPLMEDKSVENIVGWKSGDGYRDAYAQVNAASLNVCLGLVQKYRHYNARLSVQVHKFIGER